MNALSAPLAIPGLPYDRAESDRCHDVYQAVCGHHSIAAAFERKLEAVCQAFGSNKGWMSPTDVEMVLHRLGQRFSATMRMKTKKLRDGVCRVQFEGSWLGEGVPPKAAYLHTHWIGVRNGHVLDTVVDSCTWIPIADWFNNADFYYVEDKVTGWHITNWYQLA